MKNSFGSALTVTIFGESHGAAIGAVIDGIAPGIAIDDDYIRIRMAQRRPAGKISTKRREADEIDIISGVFNGRTTGTPLTIVIKNKDTKSSDYEAMRSVARPSHADYTAYCKYRGFEDYRGGGHFSGRVTAALVAAGAIVMKALEGRGIYIGTHIKRCALVNDRDFGDCREDIRILSSPDFPVLDQNVAPVMKEAIEKAAAEGDSVGGVLETAVIGLEAGLGEPWFDSVESLLSHALFSVPAIKGVEFGAGFDLADMRGSDANDPMTVEDGRIMTVSNNNGGINGGITNGMPVIFRTAVKPTPSIYKEQKTADFVNNRNTTLLIRGRHDPAIVHRARAVVDAVTALTLADLLAARHGTDWLRGGDSEDGSEKS